MQGWIIAYRPRSLANTFTTIGVDWKREKSEQNSSGRPSGPAIIHVDFSDRPL
jgi:hypothetical protein